MTACQKGGSNCYVSHTADAQCHRRRLVPGVPKVTEPHGGRASSFRRDHDDPARRLQVTEGIRRPLLHHLGWVHLVIGVVAVHLVRRRHRDYRRMNQ
jgi:hypothetical protein